MLNKREIESRNVLVSRAAPIKDQSPKIGSSVSSNDIFRARRPAKASKAYQRKAHSNLHTSFGGTSSKDGKSGWEESRDTGTTEAKHERKGLSPTDIAHASPDKRRQAGDRGGDQKRIQRAKVAVR